MDWIDQKLHEIWTDMLVERMAAMHEIDSTKGILRRAKSRLQSLETRLNKLERQCPWLLEQNDDEQ